MTSDNGTRRSLLSALGAAVGAFAIGSRHAGAQATAPASPFQPARHAQDDWMNALPGKHRTVIDCAGRTAAGTGIFYANNIFTANRNGYQLADSDVAVIVVLRHEATTYAYNDAMWTKYGAVLANMLQISDPQTKQAPRPQMANLERDYPDRSTKPIDSPYGPYADDFPPGQHRFGPFQPIEQHYKALKTR